MIYNEKPSSLFGGLQRKPVFQQAANQIYKDDSHFYKDLPLSLQKNTTNMNNKKLKLQQEFDLLLYVNISSVI